MGQGPPQLWDGRGLLRFENSRASCAFRRGLLRFSQCRGLRHSEAGVSTNLGWMGPLPLWAPQSSQGPSVPNVAEAPAPKRRGPRCSQNSGGPRPKAAEAPLIPKAVQAPAPQWWRPRSSQSREGPCPKAVEAPAFPPLLERWGLHRFGAGVCSPSPRYPPAKRRPLVVPRGLRAHTLDTLSPPPWGVGSRAGSGAEFLASPPSRALRWYPLRTVVGGLGKESMGRRRRGELPP